MAQKIFHGLLQEQEPDTIKFSFVMQFVCCLVSQIQVQTKKSIDLIDFISSTLRKRKTLEENSFDTMINKKLYHLCTSGKLLDLGNLFYSYKFS